MASIDAANRFSQNQAGYTALTPTLEGELVTATAILSGVIDRLSSSDTGSGKPIFAFVQVAYGDGTSGSDFNPGTSATFQIIGGDNGPTPAANYGAITNPVVLSQSIASNGVAASAAGACLTANLKHGALVQMSPLLPGVKKRSLYLYVQVTGGSATAGAIVAGLISEYDRPQAFVQPGNGSNTPGPVGHTL